MRNLIGIVGHFEWNESLVNEVYNSRDSYGIGRLARENAFCFHQSKSRRETLAKMRNLARTSFEGRSVVLP